jgi:hypothetical protein
MLAASEDQASLVLIKKGTIYLAVSQADHAGTCSVVLNCLVCTAFHFDGRSKNRMRGARYQAPRNATSGSTRLALRAGR